MDLPNVFRSSDFWMRTGDTLHVLIKDETGTAPVIYLTSEDNPSVPEAGTPLPPVIGEATDILSTSFSANWSASTGATKYYLDVATDNTFTSFVSGFENKDVGDVVTYSVTGLSEGTTYYYRVRACNAIGTGISSRFITATTSGLIDMDGNLYTTVIIGDQEWMVESLKTTKYADGSSIDNKSVDADWMADTTGAYCWYDNVEGNKADYGALYNWYAVTNAKGLALNQFKNAGVVSEGWRIPTETDFNTLVAEVGGDAVAGGKLKESGTTHWLDPNTATDDYGFALRGGGYRCGADGIFWNGNDDPLAVDSLSYTALWTSTENNATQGKYRWTVNAGTMLNQVNGDKTEGCYVRCVRDVV